MPTKSTIKKYRKQTTEVYTVQEVFINARPINGTHEPVHIKTSASAANFARKIWDDPDSMMVKEKMYVIFMNRRNRVVNVQKVSEGGVAGTVIDIKHIMFGAISTMACSIILVHNHPSGNRSPSTNDEKITRKTVEAGKILDVSVLDHIILTPDDGYFSMADECSVTFG